MLAVLHLLSADGSEPLGMWGGGGVCSVLQLKKLSSCRTGWQGTFSNIRKNHHANWRPDRDQI